ncbi:MAG: OmpA family protein [Acidobacteriota bacterium]
MIRTKQFAVIPAGLAFSAMLVLGGCATSKSVDQKIATAQIKTDQKIESVASQVEQVQQKQQLTDLRVDQLSKTAQDALERATEAGVLARGKVVLEQTISDDNVHFRNNSYELSKESKASLDDLAKKVKDENAPVFIEIQGHTDSRGSQTSNDRLGERRAEAVRRYLSKEYSIPLVRMSTISYGETAPVAANGNRAGRAQNRRVVVVVLE